MARFAKGKFALAISDISGQAFPWNEMVTQWNGLFVHYSEFESKQPQLNPYPHQADATALPKVRVQQPPPDALRWLGYNPFQTYAAASGIINVHQLDHQRSYGDTVRFRGAPTTSPGTGTADTINNDGPVEGSGSSVPGFANIPNADGITGAKMCLAAGYTIKPGKLFANTSTLNGAIDASTTTVLLASATQFTGVATGQYEPTSTNPVGTPTWGVLIDTEILSYTGTSGNNLTGITRFQVLEEVKNSKLYREFKVGYKKFSLDLEPALEEINTESLIKKAGIFFNKSGLLLNWKEFNKLQCKRDSKYASSFLTQFLEICRIHFFKAI